MAQPQNLATGRGNPAEFRKILVGFDGSEHSMRALRMACALAGKFLSQLVVVTVYSSPAYAPISPSVPIFVVESVKKSLEKKAKEPIDRKYVPCVYAFFSLPASRVQEALSAG